MLQWNELRITPDGKYLIIDVEVQNLDFYEKIHIETLWMEVFDNADNYKSKGRKFYIWRDYNAPNPTGEEYESVGEEGTTYKRIRKFIDIDSIGDNIFFIHATNNDDFASDTPCGAKEISLDGIAYNKRLLYNNAIKLFSKQCECTPNDSLIDFILHTKGFELSLEMCDYKGALKYWDFAVKNKGANINYNCGCK